MKLGKRQLAMLQAVGPQRAMLIATKADQALADRLVDLGLAAYPPPTAARRHAGVPTITDGGWLIIRAAGLAALEAAGLWPHPVGEQPKP